jgi:hypothetical protein
MQEAEELFESFGDDSSDDDKASDSEDGHTWHVRPLLLADRNEVSTARIVAMESKTSYIDA